GRSYPGKRLKAPLASGASVEVDFGEKEPVEVADEDEDEIDEETVDLFSRPAELLSSVRTNGQRLGFSERARDGRRRRLAFWALVDRNEADFRIDRAWTEASRSDFYLLYR
ncbi:MAG: hypothetical protein AAF517_07365, partial [Planctomycetota bacterium]